MSGRIFDVVVVGGGSAGCALTGRLVERTDRRVLLLEAGPTQALPEQLRAASSLAATAPDHPLNWAYPALLRREHPTVVPRGRVLGGSSAINGAVWLRATPADCDGWGPGWTYDDLLPHYNASETDHDHDGPRHGSDGPIPVRRPSGERLHPAARRFLAAADALGLPREPDKNAGGPPGAGLVPSNSVDGIRVDAATAYLRPHPNLTVRCDAHVRRVLVDGDRTVGVELRDGTRVAAGEVVLAAGAVGTPLLLLASGIGPAADLRAAGIEVRHDLAGVGQGWSDHPAVFVPFRAGWTRQLGRAAAWSGAGAPGEEPGAADGSAPGAAAGPDIDGVRAAPAQRPPAPAVQAALDLDAGADPAGDVEVLLFVGPFVPDGDLHLMCLLQRPDSRGSITLPVADGPPRIEYRYLRTEHDRRRLRHAIRIGAELLRAGLGTRTAPGGDVLGNDRALDGWIATQLTTAVHLCGSAAIGSVVDAQLNVLGIRGLRIADTSALPTAPRRGPAATAVAIGEKAAAMLAESH